MAACMSQVWENKIQAMVEDSQDAIIFTGGSRGEDGTIAGGTPSGGKRVGWGGGWDHVGLARDVSRQAWAMVSTLET